MDKGTSWPLQSDLCLIGRAWHGSLEEHERSRFVIMLLCTTSILVGFQDVTFQTRELVPRRGRLRLTIIFMNMQASTAGLIILLSGHLGDVHLELCQIISGWVRNGTT